jgi:hypothetical protein
VKLGKKLPLNLNYLIPNGDYSILDTHFCRFLILVYHFVNEFITENCNIGIMATGVFTVPKVTRKTKNLTGALRDANIPWCGQTFIY